MFRYVPEIHSDYDPEEMTCPICKKNKTRHQLRWTKDCQGISYRLVCVDCYDQVMEDGYDGQYYDESDEFIFDDY